MRSVPAGSFERVSRAVTLWRAWRAYARGKRRRPPVAAFDIDADRHVFAIHRALRDGTYRPGRYRVMVVRDPKTRVVAAPCMADRVVQRALLDDIGPTYERGFIADSYAVCSGRGPQRAVLRNLAWTRRYRWRVSLDVRRYFLSIRRDTLLGLYARRLSDARTRELLAAMLETGAQVYETEVARRALGLDADPVAPGCGVPLGGYLSHFSGGLYLDGLDHFVKRVLKVRGYLRYMDDLALFGDTREQLAEWREAVREWLARERGLVLKLRGQDVQPTSAPSTYLGYRVSRAGLGLGPKVKRRLRVRLRAARAGAMTPEQLERSLRSLRGMLAWL